MLRQIQYFQAIVKANSFSKAADICHISQSAISQQIKVLELSLGFPLLERKKRSFSLTPAGKYFYKKSLVLLADYEAICHEAQKIALGNQAILKIGYLSNFDITPLSLTLEIFKEKYPQVFLELYRGSHEELFFWLKSETVDLVFNDQRRAFSDEYINFVLNQSALEIEISKQNPLSSLLQVNFSDLKQVPCILICSLEQGQIEEQYFKEVLGFQGNFLEVRSLEEAKLQTLSGQGFRIMNEMEPASHFSSLCRIPLVRENSPIFQTNCLFWKKNNSGYYVEEFAEIFQKIFIQRQ